MADGDITVEAVRRQWRKTNRVDRWRAVVGDENGTIRDPSRKGYVLVRIQQANGLSAPKSVRWRATAVLKRGMPVMLGYDSDYELAVVDYDFDGQVSVGVDPAINNPADPAIYNWTSQNSIVTLLSYPLSTQGTPSTAVGVRAWIYVVDGVLKHFAGTTVELSSYIPTSGLHCVAVLFLTNENTIEVQVSTTKSVLDPLTLTGDIQSCLDARSDFAIPIATWRLHDGQTAITEQDFFLDLRAIINVDRSFTLSGNPNTIERTQTVPAGTQSIYYDSVTIGPNGTLLIEGDLIIL